MKFIFIFGSALIIFFCFFNYFPFGNRSPSYVKIAHRITAQTTKKLEETHNKLYLIGTGGGMMNDIQMMAMSFNYRQQVELNEARRLILCIIDEYLMAINSNESVRPYLHDNPFTAKNIEIRIWIYELDGSFPPLDKIEYFSAIDGVLTYYVTGEEKYSENILCKETYEEAKRMVDDSYLKY